MSEELIQAADQALEAAIAETGARDPREFYRERLRELKDANPAGYDESVTYYRATRLPSVAGGAAPLDAWTEYGRRLAQAVAPGRTVSIDETGRAHAWEGPDISRLVLHLPDDTASRALLVGLPTSRSPAKRATFDVLGPGKPRSCA